MATKYNFELEHIPARTERPRTTGLTMVMDKGLSLRQAEDFLSMSADYVDFIKLGFGTSVISKNLKEKIKLYQNAGMKVYLGGTLLEAFIVRNKVNDYIKNISDLGLNCAEVSDGSITLNALDQGSISKLPLEQSKLHSSHGMNESECFWVPFHCNPFQDEKY